MRIVARRIGKARAAPPYGEEVLKEIRRTLRNKVIPELRREFNKIVKNWKNKPGFTAKQVVTAGNISVFVRPKGKNAKIWRWVSRGTGSFVPGGSAYKIKPKRRATRRRRRTHLVFMQNYAPKTKPGGFFGGPGKSSGKLIFAKQVMHPGIEPRKFEEEIQKKYLPRYRRHVENAIRRGIRRAKKKVGQ